jgi:hypothetical protein
MFDKQEARLQSGQLAHEVIVVYLRVSVSIAIKECVTQGFHFNFGDIKLLTFP